MFAQVVPWLVAAPALASLLMPLIGIPLGRHRRILYPLTHGLVLLMAIRALPLASNGAAVRLEPLPIGDTFLLSFDQLSILGILLAAVLFLGISTFSCGFIGKARNGGGFLRLLLVEQMAANLVLLAGNLFVLYAGLLLLSISLMLMVGIDFTPGSERAALRLIVTPEVPALVALVSFWLIDAKSATVALGDLSGQLPRLDSSVSLLLVAPIALALLSRVGLFPFQTWVVVGCRAAATPVAVAIGAVAIPLGTLVLQRLAGTLTVLDPTGLQILAIAGAATTVVAGFGALRERTALGWLGYAAVAQAGFSVVGFTAGSQVGLTGAWLNLVGGSLAIALVGLSLGLLTRATRQDQIGGPAQLPRSWLARLCLGIGFLAVAGVPPFPTFAAHQFVLAGVLGADSAGSSAVAVLLLVGSFSIAGSAWQALFYRGSAHAATNGNGHVNGNGNTGKGNGHPAASISTEPEMVLASTAGTVKAGSGESKLFGKGSFHPVGRGPRWITRPEADAEEIGWESQGTLVVLAILVGLLGLAPLSFVGALVGLSFTLPSLAHGLAAAALLALAVAGSVFLNPGWNLVAARLPAHNRLSRPLFWLGDRWRLAALADPYLVVGGSLLFLGRVSALVLNNTLGRLARGG